MAGAPECGGSAAWYAGRQGGKPQRCPTHRCGSATVLAVTGALADVDAVRVLVAAAGFRHVEIRPVRRTVRFPSAEDWVRRYVAATPLAAMVARLEEPARLAVLRDTVVAIGQGG